MGQREENLLPNKRPERVSTMSVSTTASTPIARAASAKFLQVSCNVTLGIRFDTAAASGSVTACTLANDGTRHAHVPAGGGIMHFPIPTDCTFISIIGDGSGTAYLEQV